MNDDDLADWPTGRLLSVAARRLEHAWEQVLAEHGLTHAGLIALHCLADEPQYQREIARRCRVTDQTMSRTLDRLAELGCITRHRDAADQRRTQVRITETGRQRYQAVVQQERSDPRLIAGLDDQSELRRHLLALIAHLERSGPSH
ncbi:MarR family winged helix-turn-helix transcriptional regulator [Lolliginicoccus suaedae]|uniref:MarR family winged helix-turn-helix transcriptional regulator n=1 Tax=Lolliginicoccus suaedae TaxID=2605429 RepID=UPI0011ED2011|nr:MarR family transcriptional regulator [Lolliginicoccus suaedae]